MSNEPDSDRTQTFVPLTNGTMVSHYRIINRIGAGGMGEVYLAEDTALNRKVALKFLPAHLSQDTDCRARFTREAQAAAKLDHPNIVAVHEVGEFHGRPFFSMQLVEGQSLKEVLAGKSLPLDRIVEIVVQICDGLHAAHEEGITHRDIKPTNILVDTHGRARIVDFGLASISGADHLTRAGSTLGTVGYMSPEQVRGEEMDQRTDIFSLGVVLFEMVTGKQPFRGNNDTATSRNILDAEPEPLARYKSGVSAELQRIVGKALAKDKNMRYQHADELAADLRSLKSQSGTHPAPPTIKRRVSIPLLVIFSILVVALVLKPWRFMISPSYTGTASARRIVVVPFRNQTGDPSLDPLGKVVADWTTQSLLATGLGEIVPTERLPRTTQDLGLKDIVDSTGANTIILGTIYKLGDSVQFQAQVMNDSAALLQAIDPVYSKTVTVMNGVESVRQRVLGALAVLLDQRLSGSHAFLGKAPKYEAYQEYLIAVQYFDEFEMRAALEHYDRAYAADTTFLAPLLGAWAANWNLGKYPAADSLTRVLKGRRTQMTVRQQLTLDSREAMLKGRWSRALEIERQISEISPGPWTSFQLGWTACAANRPGEAIKAFTRFRYGTEARRLWSPYWDFLARARHLIGDHDKELETAKLGREQYPNAMDCLDAEIRALAALGEIDEINKCVNEFLSLPAQLEDCGAGAICNLGMIMQAAGEELRAHGYEEEAMSVFGRAVDWYRRLPEARLRPRRQEYAQVLAELRQYEEARGTIDQLVKEHPDSVDLRGLLGIVAAKQNDTAVASETQAWLQNLKDPYLRGANTYYRAGIAASRGDKDEAISLLRECYEQGQAHWISDHRNFAFELLWTYPPFVELMKPRG